MTPTTATSRTRPDPAAAYRQVCAQIAAAQSQAGRPAGTVNLVAVSKTHGPERILPVIEAGHRLFGENRVQEAQAKWPAIRAAHPGVELHLIGPLQTNKVRDALSLFDVIQTVDREKLARHLARALTDEPRPTRFFVQVNTGEEPQKAGIRPQETDAFIALCRDQLSLPVEGLMCIPPIDDEPSLHFALLAKLAARNGLTGLSMGMSADFEAAIRLGATHVRVGSAIFGPRQPRSDDDAA